MKNEEKGLKICNDIVEEFRKIGHSYGVIVSLIDEFSESCIDESDITPEEKEALRKFRLVLLDMKDGLELEQGFENATIDDFTKIVA